MNNPKIIHSSEPGNYGNLTICILTLPTLDKASDAEILKVIEAYCSSGKTRQLMRKLISYA